MEKARDGDHTVADLMSSARKLLGINNVMPEVPALLHEVQVECTFPDGTKLVTVHSPINLDNGQLKEALYGSFLDTPSAKLFQSTTTTITTTDVIPPGYIFTPKNDDDIILNKMKHRVLLKVTNTGDRPIQVGSHYHFVETNPFLKFDRKVAFGRRLDICSGTAVRFEPSETKTVKLVSIGGKKIICGGNNLVRQEMMDIHDDGADGTSSSPDKKKMKGGGGMTMAMDISKMFCSPPVGDSSSSSSTNTGIIAGTTSYQRSIDIGNPSDGFIQRLQALGFCHEDNSNNGTQVESADITTMSRKTYADTFGPTTGDRIRLGDTNLVIEVEYDLIAGEDKMGYGDEVKFGGGKVLRDGLGQASGLNADDALDTVITNALIVDYTGIYKADVGIKGGKIVGIGKAGNPDTMDNVHPLLYVGVTVSLVSFI